MIQPKKATDQAIYQRYKDCPPDHAMRAFVEWYERGKRPPKRSYPIHEKARAVIEKLQQGHKLTDIINHFDTYESLVRRILTGDYRRVPDYKARQIAGYDGEPIETVERVDAQITHAEYKRAQKILKLQVNDGASYADLANKYSIEYRTLYQIAKDQYKQPHPEALKVLDK